MQLGNKDKKVSFRLSTEQYYSIYRIYENYLKACPNLSFSDFVRNLILTLIANVNEQIDNGKQTNI